MTTAELDHLARRANEAGFESIADYALWLEVSAGIAHDILEDDESAAPTVLQVLKAMMGAQA